MLHNPYLPTNNFSDTVAITLSILLELLDLRILEMLDPVQNKSLPLHPTNYPFFLH